MAAHPSFDARGMLGQLQLSEGADQLLAWAEELSRLQANWVSEREAFLVQHFAQQSAMQDAIGQRAWLEPLAGQMHSKHQGRQAELVRSLAQSKSTLLQKCQVLAQDCDHLEQASLKRQRLARCRLQREQERLAAREERMAREARERERREVARLEGERARAEERRSRLERERRRLEVELEKDRALWQQETSTAGTQTMLTESSKAEAPMPPRAATSQARVGSDSYSSDSEFYSDSQSVSRAPAGPEGDTFRRTDSTSRGDSDYTSIASQSEPLKPSRQPAVVNRPVQGNCASSSIDSLASIASASITATRDKKTAVVKRAVQKARASNSVDSLASIASSCVEDESIQSKAAVVRRPIQVARASDSITSIVSSFVEDESIESIQSIRSAS